MSTTAQKYEYFQVNGHLKIVPVDPKEVKDQNLLIYILLGPTGSGKSSFIESLAPGQHLNISKDSLESVTQKVNCYHIVNLDTQHMLFVRTFVLMDTPGFLDPRLSEGRITRMVTECLDVFHPYAIVTILYFQPITDIRISGSKRHSFKILREYVNLYKAHNVTVITTMWNTICTARQLEDANRRFDSLKNEIYASSDGLKIEVTKFDTSSKDSALSSLDKRYFGWSHNNVDSNNIIGTPYQSLLRDNLLGRITTVLQQLQFLAEDKRSATSPGSEEHCLLRVVLGEEKVALASLQSFLDDLASDVIGPAGMIALQSLLDTRYDQDPGACSSCWPLSQALPVASPIPLPEDAPQSIVTSDIPSDPAPAVPLPVAQGSRLDQLSIRFAPIPSAAQGQTPSPDASQSTRPLPVAVSQSLERLITPGSTPQTPQHQPPSPDASCCAPFAASFKRRFNWIIR